MIPRLKDSIEIRENGSDLHCIFTGTGRVLVFEADETSRGLLRAMDGTRDVEALYEFLYGQNPQLTRDELKVTLSTMLEHRLIEDMAQSEHSSSAFGPEELVMMDRQIKFLDEFTLDPANGLERQERLKRSRVVLLGLGGTGCGVASLLAQAGIGELILLDDDVVELSNLNRQQLYRRTDVGKKKVVAATQRLLDINPFMMVTTHDIRLTEETDLAPIIAGADAVVNCTDVPNVFTTGMWVAKACMPLRIPHLVGGGYNRHLGMIGPTILPYRSPCWGCYAEQVVVQDLAQYPVFIPRRTSAAASFGPISSLVASIQAFEVVKIITRMAQPAMVGRKAEVDVLRLDISFEVFRRHPRCKLCGGGAKVNHPLNSVTPEVAQ